MGLLLNAEGLRIESIDRIELTLNPLLAFFIDWEQKNNINKHLKIRYNKKFGLHYYLDIQAQFIYQYPEVKLSLVNAISELMEKSFITFKLPIPFIYEHLDYFVHEVREIEFAFDFRPEAITVTNQDKLIHCEDSRYTIDRRRYANRPARKSLAKIYDRIKSLRRINQIQLEKIISNPFSQRIEFCLAKYNCSYRSINNITGSWYDIIASYIPFLAIVYRKYFYGNIIVDTMDHPFFDAIINLVKKNRFRYTGGLEKMVTHKASRDEKEFYKWMIMTGMGNKNISTDKLVMLALANL